jgi:hypothetical protein
MKREDEASEFLSPANWKEGHYEINKSLVLGVCWGLLGV